eukprot:3058773-Amphidinium_carterae.1
MFVCKLEVYVDVILDCKEDDDVDANGDGKSDAKQLLDNGDYDELLKRKTLVVLKTVNPEEVPM